jgi:hypothetical protein
MAPANGHESGISEKIFPISEGTGQSMYRRMQDNPVLVYDIQEELNRNHPVLSQACTAMSVGWRVLEEHQPSFYTGCLVAYKYVALQALRSGVDLPDIEAEYASPFFEKLSEADPNRQAYLTEKADVIEEQDEHFFEGIDQFLAAIKVEAEEADEAPEEDLLEERYIIMFGALATYDFMKFHYGMMDMMTDLRNSFQAHESDAKTAPQERSG